MKRIALVIGVGVYDRETDLPGATADAKRLSGVLFDEHFGAYDRHASKLLLSPRLEDIRAGLAETAFNARGADTFTLFFAGHGIWAHGSFYLCPRDVNSNRLSVTALCISELFLILNEAKPVQTNIIIDACNAGGLVGDLSSLLKPESFGDALSPSVALFASSMRNESAGEDDRGGYATQLLLDIMVGDRVISRSSPYLDLVHIGSMVSVDIQARHLDQTPALWGFNITGPSNFTKNPHYSEELGGAVWERVPPWQHHLSIPDEAREILWDAYLKLAKPGELGWLVGELSRAINQIVLGQVSNTDMLSLLLGISDTFAVRAAQSPNSFAQAETLAAIAAVALPYASASDSSRLFFESMFEKISERISQSFAHLSADIERSETNALLSKSQVLSDLYFLPVRLAKILGWIGVYGLLKAHRSSQANMEEGWILRILDFICTNHAGSLAAISEEQAPYIFLYSNFAKRFNGDDRWLEPLQFWIADFFRREGMIARHDLDGSEILAFLLADASNSYESVSELVARPTNLGAVLLYWASQLDMDELIDPFMIQIDHLPINVFLPEDLRLFGERRIPGVNVTMQIGSDTGDGVFHMSDMRRVYESFCIPRIDILTSAVTTEVVLTCSLASLLLPDRICWPAHGLSIPQSSQESLTAGETTEHVDQPDN